jgi:agmatine deiminase
VFAFMVEVLHARERVCINVADEAMEARVRRRLAARGIDEARVGFLHAPTDDAWVRDHGPIFVRRDSDGEVALVDFDFDAWGGKYPPWERDDDVPRRAAEALGMRRFRGGAVLEGGSIDGDGEGAVLTTESCLLNPNRGKGRPRTRESMEALLRDTLAAREVLWLGDGIAGDDTDGHVDDFARFVAPGVVVVALEADPASPNHAPLRENQRRLRELRDARGRRLEQVAIPMPPPLVVAGQPCPASYANFYLANGVALVPTFGAPSDERALAILREGLGAGREVVGVPAADLVVGLGAVHCLTQQQPA